MSCYSNAIVCMYLMVCILLITVSNRNPQSAFRIPQYTVHACSAASHSHSTGLTAADSTFSEKGMEDDGHCDSLTARLVDEASMAP
jgi:hypothetical protein